MNSKVVIAIKWILLVGGPLFFFFRAINLILTGGDCFSTINSSCSWVLLTLEFVLSGLAGITGVIGLVLWKFKKIQLKNLNIFVIYTGISSYIIHFTRVIIWIGFCVL